LSAGILGLSVHNKPDGSLFALAANASDHVKQQYDKRQRDPEIVETWANAGIALQSGFNGFAPAENGVGEILPVCPWELIQFSNAS
jgi:hypothetical protein